MFFQEVIDLVNRFKVIIETSPGLKCSGLRLMILDVLFIALLCFFQFPLDVLFFALFFQEAINICDDVPFAAALGVNANRIRKISGNGVMVLPASGRLPVFGVSAPY